MHYKSVEELQSTIARKPVHLYLLEKVKAILEQDADPIWIITADTGRKISFSEVEPLSRKIASALTKRGLRKGDCIALYSNNHIHYLLPILAAWRCGAISALVGSECTADGLVEHLDQVMPKFLFCHTKTAKKALEAAARCPSVQEVIVIDTPYEGCTFLQDIYRDDGSAFNDLYECDFENDVILLPFSSGTTGKAKAVAQSHRAVVGTFLLWEDFIRTSKWLDVTRLFKGVSFHHSTAMYEGFACLATNNTFITLEEYSVEATLQAISKEKPVTVTMHPHTSVSLAKYADTSKYDLSSVRTLLTTGGALPKTAAEQLQLKFPNVLHVGQCYGTTECGYITLQNPLDPKRGEKKDSVGKPSTDILVKIVDPETGTELGPNQDGEICVRNKYFMKGYYKQPQATAEVLRDDWYYTGDVGRLDDDGYLYITGRIKEIIKYDVNHVSPSQLEDILLRHDDVKDCAVCGIPNEDHGYLPKAFVVPKSGARVTEQELVEFVNSQVADYEKLRGGLVFVDDIPRNQTGKILRRLLVQL